MTVAATMDDFRQALRKALEEHAPQANVMLEEKRGVIVEGRVKPGRDAFVAVYFNALSGRASYALIHQGRRLAGYDNYRFWHYHPPGDVGCHVACDEPTPEEAVARLIAVFNDNQS